jgi:hypothetical protein
MMNFASGVRNKVRGTSSEISRESRICRDKISREKEAGTCIRRGALTGAMMYVRLSHGRVVQGFKRNK